MEATECYKEKVILYWGPDAIRNGKIFFFLFFFFGRFFSDVDYFKRELYFICYHIVPALYSVSFWPRCTCDPNSLTRDGILQWKLKSEPLDGQGTPCRFFNDGHCVWCEVLPHCSFDLHKIIIFNVLILLDLQIRDFPCCWNTWFWDKYSTETMVGTHETKWHDKRVFFWPEIGQHLHLQLWH